MAMGCELNLRGVGFESLRGQDIFLHCRASLSPVGSIQPAIDYVSGLQPAVSIPHTPEDILMDAETSYINQNETNEPLEPRTSSDPRTHEGSSPIEVLACQKQAQSSLKQLRMAVRGRNMS
jgi:hypothetical protein